MNEETQKQIDKLKRIRLELFRNAADLDNVIQSIECCLADEEHSEDLKVAFMKEHIWHRHDVKVAHDWDLLDQDEEDTYTGLLNIFLNDNEEIPC